MQKLGDRKNQNNLSKIETFHLSSCKQRLGVKITQAVQKCWEKLLTIETKLFKYLQRIPLKKEDCYLPKAFNGELANKELGWVTKMRHLQDFYNMSNLISNIFKVLNDEIDKKKYKNKDEIFSNETRDCCKKEKK